MIPRPYTSPEMSDSLSIATIEAAASRIRGVAVETPLLESPELSQRTGGRVFLKPEMLQRTGSFKFRGAFNRLSQLTAAERERGVVTFSSGNHAQAVAAAAKLLATPAVILMPQDAPSVKLERTRRLGAEIVLFDRWRDDRDALAAVIATERGLVVVPPFDDYDVMAGQGTIGLEICHQAAALGVEIDEVFVPCGGGGLCAGVSTAIKAMRPATRVFAAEPAAFDDTARSLAAGSRLGNAAGASSICDALLAPMPGKLTFKVNQANLAGAVTASDDEVRRAIGFAFAELRLVAEPGGAVGLAAILAGRADVAGKTIAIVLSGGNVDPSVFAAALGQGE
jgi:threonine dehydratase